MSDYELLVEFRMRGNRNALSKLIEKYERLVWSVCRRKLYHLADVEDAFQSTFLVLVERADRIRNPDSIGAWLYGVARRTADQIRRNRAKLSTRDEKTWKEIQDPNDIFASIARQQVLDCVDQQIQAMPELHRTPMILKYYGGFSAKEIAAQMNLSVAAVEGRLKRAKASLRQQLNQNSDQYPISFAGLVCGFVPCSWRIESVMERCVTTLSGSHSGLTSVFSLGTKIMICKSLCAAGISALLIVGTVLHLGGSPTAASAKPMAVHFNATSPNQTFSTRINVETDDSANEDEDSLLYQHLKQVHELHQGFADHIIDFFHWLHR